MKRLRLLLALLLTIGSGALLWWIQFSPQNPSASLAQFKPVLPGWQETISNADQTVAQGIREVAAGRIKLGDILPVTAWQQVSNATLSAEIVTSPDELWRTWREQGSQAVLQSLGNNVEYKVNDVSAATVNEVRYQYCKGVVEEYEKH